MKESLQTAFSCSSFLLSYPELGWREAVTELQEEIEAIEQEEVKTSLTAFIKQALDKTNDQLIDSYVYTFDFGTDKLERRVVKMMDQFLWVLFPYIIFAIFIGGHIFRYNYDQFGWTSKSSELLEKKMLRIGSLLFHFGIMFVIGGHVMGILIPESVYRSIGITEHMYHIVAISFGLPAGVASIVGLIILTYRRVTVKRIIATSTKGDYIALILLLIVMLAGLSSTFLNIDSKGFDYRTTIGPWFRSLFIFQPKVEYMTEVPVWFKIHILAGLGLFAVWPFTRLVHVFSAPIKYLSRSYVIYRRRIPNELKK